MPILDQMVLEQKTEVRNVLFMIGSFSYHRDIGFYMPMGGRLHARVDDYSVNCRTMVSPVASLNISFFFR